MAIYGNQHPPLQYLLFNMLKIHLIFHHLHYLILIFFFYVSKIQLIFSFFTIAHNNP